MAGHSRSSSSELAALGSRRAGALVGRFGPRLLKAVLVLAVIGAAGCAGGTTVTDEDEGASVTIAVGDTLTVELEANQTTPYRHVLGGVPSQLRLDSYDYKADWAPLGMTGSGGTDVWEFTATEPGSGTLVIELWEEFYLVGNDTEGYAVDQDALQEDRPDQPAGTYRPSAWVADVVVED